MSEKITVKVRPEDVPLDLRAKDVTTHSMILTWSPPIKLNPINYQVSGIVRRRTVVVYRTRASVFYAPVCGCMFQVSYDAFKEFVDSQGVTQSQPVPRKVLTFSPHIESTHIENLSPFTTYNINVTAKAADTDYRPPTRITVTTQMAAPLPMVKPDFYGVTNEEEITVSFLGFFVRSRVKRGSWV